MYPLSSRKARARNRIKILGRKVRIPPTPDMIPSTTSEQTQSEAPMAVSAVLAASKAQSSPISNQPLIASPTVKVRKNTSAMIHKNTGTPATGWVRILSAFSVID